MTGVSRTHVARLSLPLTALLIASAVAAGARQTGSSKQRVTPGEIKWPSGASSTVGTSAVPGIETVILKGDPLIGLGAYQAVMEYEWWRPLRVADRLHLRRVLLGVQVKDKSEFSGRSVHETRGFFYRNQNNELHAVQRGTWVRADSETASACDATSC